MISDQRPLSTLSVLAVVCLGGFGVFLVAISVPPLFNAVFGEEPEVWTGEGVAEGLLYIATSVLIGVFRSRLGIGLGLILGMAGFALTLGLALSRVPVGDYGSGVASPELLAGLGLAAVNAIAIVGILGAGRGWGLVHEPQLAWTLPAAVLGGIGLVFGLAFWGGALGIAVHPITEPGWFDEIRYWLPLPHYVAAVALALGGRFARAAGVAVSVSGIVVALAMLVAMLSFGASNVLESVALWILLLLAYLAAAATLIGGWRRDARGFGRGAAVVKADMGGA